jgi:hypothetical protein
MANKGSNLGTNQSLNMGDFLVSPNGNYKAIMQDDGKQSAFEYGSLLDLPQRQLQGHHAS